MAEKAGHAGHGLSGYVKNRCRCDTCRAEWNAYQRAWAKTKKGQEQVKRDGRIHSRARSELARRHHDEYQAIVDGFRSEEANTEARGGTPGEEG